MATHLFVFCEHIIQINHISIRGESVRAREERELENGRERDDAMIVCLVAFSTDSFNRVAFQWMNIFFAQCPNDKYTVFFININTNNIDRLFNICIMPWIFFNEIKHKIMRSVLLFCCSLLFDDE